MPPLEFDGFIDLGKELSILHSLLVESLEKMNEVRQRIFIKFTVLYYSGKMFPKEISLFPNSLP